VHGYIWLRPKFSLFILQVIESVVRDQLFKSVLRKLLWQCRKSNFKINRLTLIGTLSWRRCVQGATLKTLSHCEPRFIVNVWASCFNATWLYSKTWPIISQSPWTTAVYIIVFRTLRFNGCKNTIETRIILKSVFYGIFNALASIIQELHGRTNTKRAWANLLVNVMVWEPSGYKSLTLRLKVPGFSSWSHRTLPSRSSMWASW
jgi:hypothetical protein